MFGLGHWEIILILVIVLIVFGAGKLPKVAGELAKGIKSFKQGLKDDAIDILIEAFSEFEHQKREIVDKFIRMEIEFQKKEKDSYANFK